MDARMICKAQIAGANPAGQGRGIARRGAERTDIPPSDGLRAFRQSHPPMRAAGGGGELPLTRPSAASGGGLGPAALKSGCPVRGFAPVCGEDTAGLIREYAFDGACYSLRGLCLAGQKEGAFNQER